MIPLRACIAGFLFAVLAHTQPARIVTTFPSVTETVFALGAGDRIVGVSIYCKYPPAALLLPKVGTYMKPDLERIALLRPDLVIIQKSANGLGERLSSLGIQHLDVKLGNLAEIYSMIDDVGRAIGTQDRAEKLNTAIQSRLSAFRAEAAGRPHPTVLIVIGRTPGLLTNLIGVAPGSYLGELLEIAGGANVLTESTIAYPHISLETVIRLNPDVILDLSLMGESTTDPSVREARLREPWLTHQELNAVRNQMIVGLTSETLVTPGPRVADAVALLKSRIRQRGPHE